MNSTSIRKINLWNPNDIPPMVVSAVLVFGETKVFSFHRCEGRMQGAYEQRTGFLDYFYNNYATMRKCLNNMCEICHLSLAAVWKGLKPDLNPDQLCHTFSETNKPLLMSKEEAFDQVTLACCDVCDS